MKIIIPVDNDNLATNLCVSFGRAPYFMIFDSESNQSSFYVNDAANAPGGAGILASQKIADQKADVVITMRCGENAANVLKAAGIKIFKSKFLSAKENIDACLKNELDVLDNIHPGFHGHGGNV